MMYLYHYFDKRSGPFRSLTALPAEEAEKVLNQLKMERPESLCAQRDDTYIEKRRSCEAVLRREFAAKGGIMEIEMPIDVSNVQLICPSCKQSTRVSTRREGKKKIRTCKKCGRDID